MIDLLIPCWAPSGKLSSCITSVLRNTTVPYNLLVTVQQQSVARNRNALLLMGRGEYVCFLDDDVELPPGWAEPLIETLETYQPPPTVTIEGVTVTNPRVGMVGPRIVDAFGNRQNDSSDVPEGTVRPCYTCGAVMLWKRSDWPWLFADTLYEGSQAEDLDLTLQMLHAGAVPVVDARVTVRHHSEKKGHTDERWQRNHRYLRGKHQAYATR